MYRCAALYVFTGHGGHGGYGMDSTGIVTIVTIELRTGRRGAKWSDSLVIG